MDALKELEISLLVSERLKHPPFPPVFLLFTIAWTRLFPEDMYFASQYDTLQWKMHCSRPKMNSTLWLCEMSRIPEIFNITQLTYHSMY